ncbi:hypothetical protein CKO38_16350 [Rhodospirillum rubrum]|uniref:hypothetical protein n=1 Tax=Rhodospirillum rubrum TaxID=1085 RepID=UPI001908DF3E|nr:hypothetical protein [Rhodospirillum rubrum]MBK1665540.1 hypothetical protein [Rhodospirillum rubrum]MBK1678214.1 hypothetical protein [Rhodospirillum rubrum]
MGNDQRHHLGEMADSLRHLDCDSDDIVILGHDLARRIEDHLKHATSAEPRRASFFPSFFPKLD